MTGRRRSSVPSAGVLAALAAGLLLLVWAATSGPVGVLGSSGRKLGFKPLERTPTETRGPTPGSRSIQEITSGYHRRGDLSWIGTIITWTFLVGLCVGVFLVLRYLWLHRWHRPARPVEVDFDVLPTDAVAEALRSDLAGQMARIEEGGPRNGIVQCWLRLEETIASVGMPRQPAETSAEFTVRVLKMLDLDPRAIGTLAALYREARFSDHQLDEGARTTARSALQQLHSDLQELGMTAAAETGTLS